MLFYDIKLDLLNSFGEGKLSESLSLYPSVAIFLKFHSLGIEVGVLFEKPYPLYALLKKAEITSDVTMKVNSVTKEKKLTSGSLYYKPRNDGNVFAIINVSLKNASDSSKSFDLGYFRLVDHIILLLLSVNL